MYKYLQDDSAQSTLSQSRRLTYTPVACADAERTFNDDLGLVPRFLYPSPIPMTFSLSLSCVALQRK